MTQKEFDNLRRGDIVRLKGVSKSYVVQYCTGEIFYAARVVQLTNPDEWDLIKLPKKKDHE